MEKEAHALNIGLRESNNGARGDWVFRKDSG